MKRIVCISFSAGLFIVVSFGSSVLAKTPDGQTPAQESVCSSLTGAAFGLCNAYCEAQDCDVHPRPSCQQLRRNFAKVTGSPIFPCDPCCPVCGDGVCEGDETMCNSPDDCSDGGGSCRACLDYVPRCGDGQCEVCASPGESHENCPEDCPLLCRDCAPHCCVCPGLTMCALVERCPLALPECRLGPACTQREECLRIACKIQADLCNSAPCLLSDNTVGECARESESGFCGCQ